MKKTLHTSFLGNLNTSQDRPYTYCQSGHLNKAAPLWLIRLWGEKKRPGRTTLQAKLRCLSKLSNSFFVHDLRFLKEFTIDKMRSIFSGGELVFMFHESNFISRYSLSVQGPLVFLSDKGTPSVQKYPQEFLPHFLNIIKWWNYNKKVVQQVQRIWYFVFFLFQQTAEDRA